MSREVIKFVRVKAEDREQIAGLSAFASSIVKEHLTPSSGRSRTTT